MSCMWQNFQSSQIIDHQWIHSQLKPYQCDECGKAFYYSSHLVQHPRTHTGEKSFQYNECGKAFHYSSGLMRHQRTHTGEKPYQCNNCRKAFCLSSHLMQHQWVHYWREAIPVSWVWETLQPELRPLPSPENPQWGETIWMWWVWKGFLQSHFSSCWTPANPQWREALWVWCGDMCGKAFSYHSHLLQHQRIYNGEKPRECDVCGKAFQRS